MAVIISAEVLSNEIWLIKLLIKNNEIAFAINKINKINSFFSSKMNCSYNIIIPDICVFFLSEISYLFSYPR